MSENDYGINTDLNTIDKPYLTMFEHNGLVNTVRFLNREIFLLEKQLENRQISLSDFLRYERMLDRAKRMRNEYDEIIDNFKGDNITENTESLIRLPPLPRRTVQNNNPALPALPPLVSMGNNNIPPLAPNNMPNLEYTG